MKSCAECGAAVVRRLARFCDPCGQRRRRKPKKYLWTPERDAVIRDFWARQEPRRSLILAARWHLPKHAVIHRAVELGITRPDPRRRDWTPDEEAQLWALAGTWPVRRIARKLGRTEASVVLKLRRMHLRRAVREGYTIRELQLCFGVDHHAIRRWVKAGWLEVRTRGYETDRDAWAVTDEALLRFIQTHPMAFELRRVDQHWFMDLILNGALVKKALAALTAEDAAA